MLPKLEAIRHIIGGLRPELLGMRKLVEWLTYLQPTLTALDHVVTNRVIRYLRRACCVTPLVTTRRRRSPRVSARCADGRDWPTRAPSASIWCSTTGRR